MKLDHLQYCLIKCHLSGCENVLLLGMVLRYMAEESLYIMNRETKHFLYYNHLSINQYWNLLLVLVFCPLLKTFGVIPRDKSKFTWIYAGVLINTSYDSFFTFRIYNFHKNWFQFFVSVDTKAISYNIIDFIV